MSTFALNNYDISLHLLVSFYITIRNQGTILAPKCQNQNVFKFPKRQKFSICKAFQGTMSFYGLKTNIIIYYMLFFDGFQLLHIFRRQLPMLSIRSLYATTAGASVLRPLSGYFVFSHIGICISDSHSSSSSLFQTPSIQLSLISPAI